MSGWTLPSASSFSALNSFSRLVIILAGFCSSVGVCIGGIGNGGDNGSGSGSGTSICHIY